MAENVVVSVYKISSCGYLAADPELEEFGSVVELFPDLQQWISGLASVGESSTFEPSEDDEVLRTFCFDLRRIPRSNRFLIATWNEANNADDEIQLLEVSAAIGEADVSHAAIAEGALPGYPAYFVVDPSQDRLVNLRFDSRLNGSKSFARYMYGFLARESSYCQYESGSTEKLLGYGPGGSVPSNDHAPAFEYQLLRRAGSMNWFRSQVSSIRKVIRRTKIYPKIARHRPLFSGARELLGLQPNNRLSAAINFEYSFKARFDLEELEGVLESCVPGTQEDNWDDVGFVMAKDSSRIHWISGSYAREKSTLDVRRTNGGRIDTESLAETLALHFDRLVGEALR